jgi:hypothetical protein
MKRFRLPFKYEFAVTLALCVFVVMCVQEKNVIEVSIKNNCNDNIKLCQNCDHLKPGQTLRNCLTLSEGSPDGTIQLWRQSQTLAEFAVTGIKFPSEDSDGPYHETIVMTADIQDPEDPFDDNFSASATRNYVTVTKSY